jgi:hypothetical protein
VLLVTDRPQVRPAALVACGPSVYSGFLDKIPFGAAMNKGLTVRTGQTHVNRYFLDLLQRIEAGQIDPSVIITHRAKPKDGPALYEHSVTRRMFGRLDGGINRGAFRMSDFERILGRVVFQLWPVLPRDVQELLFDRVPDDPGVRNSLAQLLHDHHPKTVHPAKPTELA